MNLSRRSFLGGALAVAGAAALPSVAWASVPTIHGDGIHDDTAGLQALLDGKPFRVAGNGPMCVRRDGFIFLHNGSFRISDTLVVGNYPDAPPAHITNCHFDGRHIPNDGRPIWHFKGFEPSTIESCYFESKPMKGGSYPSLGGVHAA